MRHFILTIAVLCLSRSASLTAQEPLPSWSDTAAKKAIVAFVEKVTREGSSGFVPPADRIAVFDNDGTLWAEQPMYFQLAFAFDQIKAKAGEHPEWKTTDPFKSVLAGDYQAVLAPGKEGLLKIVATTHAGMTADEFQASVKNWLATARHPKTGRPYTEMVYQPMLELLAYLRDNNFKSFIISGGGIDFMRVFAEKTYGIPSERIVGSNITAKFEMRNGVPTIVKQAEGLFVDDQAGKPVGIYQHIGKRPIFAAGNSDGDLQMLQYTTISRDGSDTTPRFGLIVHHTDGDREWAYDRKSPFGRLDKALNEAQQHGWIVIDMKEDWKHVFRGPQSKPATPAAQF